MSDPLTSREIEDVLSSIRRLVSEELRPAARVAAADRDGGGKLLLTPALRVVTDTAAPAAAGLPPDPGPSAADTDDASEILFAAAGADDPWSPPRASDPLVAAEEDPEPPPMAADPAPRGHWSAETVPVPDIDWMQAEEDWAEDADPLPFTPHPRPGLAQDPLARAWADRAEADVRARLQDPVVVPPADAEPPRGTGADRGATGGGHGGAGGGGGPGLFDAEDPLFDEETLRDIVREIIREELAGTLGERITRNVRKLVRVEVNRALTARDFD